MTSLPDPTASVDVVVAAFGEWLEAHGGELEAFRNHPGGDLDAAFAAARPLQRLLFDGGWTRLGWPELAGGLGGSPVLRVAVLEALAAAGYVIPEVLGTVEIIAPMLVRYSPALAAVHVPAALAGDEVWCQGFSEPDAGSDLGSLRTRATATDGGFLLDGQKMWSSWGHLAQWCCVLARTGQPGYRGLTMFWVDMADPGITVQPTMCESGRAEVAEVFFDEVFVPTDRLIGEVGAGWGTVMYLMQFERGAYAWQRQADLHNDLQRLIAATAVADDADGSSFSAEADAVIGDAYLALLALRARGGATVAELAGGHDLGPEISIDKLLLGATEQVVADAARRLLWPALELSSAPEISEWRRQWSFSRITTIYGGVAEVQRDLVAERVLGLPRVR